LFLNFLNFNFFCLRGLFLTFIRFLHDWIGSLLASA
jgi:hypothetical protein